MVPSAVEELSGRAQAQDTRHLREDLQRTIVTAASLLHRLGTLTPDEVLSVVIAALAKAQRHIRITVAPAYRGTARFGLDSPLHYMIGVDVFLGPPPIEQRMSQSEVVNIVVGALDAVWGPLGIHLRQGRAPEWGHRNQPTVVLQIPIAERPRPVPAIAPVAVPGLGKRLVVLAPKYGYGELLVALLAEALGFGLVDLRYEEDAPTSVDAELPKPGKEFHRAAREARHHRAQQLLRSESNQLAWCIAGEQLLQDLQGEITSRLADTTIIGIAYGTKWAQRGQNVHETPVRNQVRNGRLAIGIAAQASSETLAIQIDYEDTDVVATESANQADVDLIANQTVLTAIRMLDLLGVPPALWREGWLKNLDSRGDLPRLRALINLRKSRVIALRPT